MFKTSYQNKIVYDHFFFILEHVFEMTFIKLRTFFVRRSTKLFMTSLRTDQEMVLISSLMVYLNPVMALGLPAHFLSVR